MKLKQAGSGCLICLPLIWLIPLVQAQRPEEAMLRGNPSASFHSSAGWSQAVVNLPDHVPAPEGKISLWADFAAADEKSVPLYVINQTNQPEAFRGQDGDLYVKLEYRDATGAWRRAQAHLSNWCGNSYHTTSLPPRHFLLLRGYKAGAGEKQTVRYALQERHLASNEGEGLVSDADLKALALDSLSSNEIPPFIWQVLESQSFFSREERQVAVQALAWLPRNERAILRAKESRAQALAFKDAEGQKELLQAYDDFLTRVDAPKPSTDRLQQLCIARITDDPSADAAMTRDVAWSLLKIPSLASDVRDGPAAILDPKQWSAVIAPAVDLMKAETPPGSSGIVRSGADMFLSSDWIVDALVKDEELLRWLEQTSSERLQDLGAAALVRRAKASAVVEHASKQPGPAKLRFLNILAYADPFNDAMPSRVRSPDHSAGEHLFWEQCVKSMPVDAANTLWRWYYADNRVELDESIHKPLRDYFAAEAAHGTVEVEVSEQDSQKFRTALEMLAAWRLEEDDNIITGMLKHGAYVAREELQRDNKYAPTQCFFYRVTARDLLVRRGLPAPPDLVLESLLSSDQKKYAR